MNQSPTSLPRQVILVGDALTRLRELPAGSVDCIVTSPPYFALRNYGVDGQLGLEPTVGEWVDALAAVLDECARVLVPNGTVWLNLGDSYATHPSQGTARTGLLLGPEQLALHLVRSGWLLRNKVVWHKTNALPTSARDRLAASYEFVYLLARQPSYFFDLDALRVPHRSRAPRGRRDSVRPRQRENWLGPNGVGTGGLDSLKARALVGHPLGRNPGDVWQLATSSYRGAHHATFPLTLADRLIRATCPEARCSRCRAPWRRKLHRAGATARRGALRASCQCDAPHEPGLVLDPFMGAGTTAVAAEQLGRDWLGIELNVNFALLAHQRLAADRERRAAKAAKRETPP